MPYILFDLVILIIVCNVTTNSLPFSRVIKIHVKSLLPF